MFTSVFFYLQNYKHHYKTYSYVIVTQNLSSYPNVEVTRNFHAYSELNSPSDIHLVKQIWKSH
jgi:hypothetical protein